jgi:hypothetical protein
MGECTDVNAVLDPRSGHMENTCWQCPINHNRSSHSNYGARSEVFGMGGGCLEWRIVRIGMAFGVESGQRNGCSEVFASFVSRLGRALAERVTVGVGGVSPVRSITEMTAARGPSNK